MFSCKVPRTHNKDLIRNTFLKLILAQYSLVQVGTHEEACHSDMLAATKSCTVHTRGHAARKSFSDKLNSNMSLLHAPPPPPRLNSTRLCCCQLFLQCSFKCTTKPSYCNILWLNIYMYCYQSQTATNSYIQHFGVTNLDIYRQNSVHYWRFDHTYFLTYSWNLTCNYKACWILKYLASIFEDFCLQCLNVP